MHDHLVKLYGQDVVDLVRTIENKLTSYLKNRSFDGNYAINSEFRMVPNSSIGLFVVKFPNTKFVAVAGIDMITGDYILSSMNNIPIFKLENLDMKRLIKLAENDWAMELPGGKFEAKLV